MELVVKNNEELLRRLLPENELPIYCNSVIDPRAEVFNQPYYKTIMNEIVIHKTNGKWLINGKSYSELLESNNVEELAFFDDFLAHMKWELEKENEKRILTLNAN